MSYCGNK